MSGLKGMEIVIAYSVQLIHDRNIQAFFNEDIKSFTNPGDPNILPAKSNLFFQFLNDNRPVESSTSKSNAVFKISFSLREGLQEKHILI